MRRATVEDLAQLRILWGAARLPALELEKNFTEVQVADAPGGGLAGAVSFTLLNRQGHLHSEVFAHPELEPEVRAALWNRLLNLARNHGLSRLWVAPSVTFWRDQGFLDADAKALGKLPAVFGSTQTAWLTLPMREETTAFLSAEQQFELFASTQQQERERLLATAKSVRAFSYLLIVLLFGAAAAAAIYAFKRVPAKR